MLCLWTTRTHTTELPKPQTQYKKNEKRPYTITNKEINLKHQDKYVVVFINKNIWG